jgi:hypothetical protein
MKKASYCQDFHRRNYYPDTDRGKLFKSEQPEYNKPLSNVHAKFVKVDFTAGEKSKQLNIIARKAEEHEHYMRIVEDSKKRQLNKFWGKTNDRAERIKREKRKEEKLKQTEVRQK